MKTTYDYIIIGAGCAGLHLALAFLKTPFFKHKEILLLEKSAKQHNDKTWCFWEIGDSPWDEITKKSWDKASFINNKEHIPLHLSPYRYKQVASVDFYNYAFAQLKASQNINIRRAEVLGIQKTALQKVVNTSIGDFSANIIFDSRPPEVLIPKKSEYLLQHFKGVFIKTTKPVFTPERFTIMDYRLKDQEQTNFMYVLPKSETEALVEHTYFNTQLQDDEHCHQTITEYLFHHFGLSEKDFRIMDTEKGIIPMNTFPYHNAIEEGYVPIGTRGGWVKPSTGYSFKNAERLASLVAFNLSRAKKPGNKWFRSRFRWYDRIFIKVLYYYNHKGSEVFTAFYKNNSTPRLFRFLEEKTNFFEDLTIILSMPKGLFLKSLFKKYR